MSAFSSRDLNALNIRNVSLSDELIPVPFDVPPAGRLRPRIAFCGIIASKADFGLPVSAAPVVAVRRIEALRLSISAFVRLRMDCFAGGDAGGERSGDSAVGRGSWVRGSGLLG